MARPIRRAVHRERERAVDGDVPQAVENAGPFLKRETLGGDVEIERRRLRLAVHAPGDNEFAARRQHLEVVEDPARRPVRQPAGDPLIDRLPALPDQETCESFTRHVTGS